MPEHSSQHPCLRERPALPLHPLTPHRMQTVLSTFAKCNVTGSGWGCTWASASEDSHAKALHSAWNAAKGDSAFTTQGCSCLISQFSSTYSTWEAWKGLARKAKGWLESSFCQYGTLCLQQLIGSHHRSLHPSCQSRNRCSSCC
jgi:hypothetical protein